MLSFRLPAMLQEALVNRLSPSDVTANGADVTADGCSVNHPSPLEVTPHDNSVNCISPVAPQLGTVDGEIKDPFV